MVQKSAVNRTAAGLTPLRAAKYGKTSEALFYSSQSFAAMSFMARQLRRKACAAEGLRFISSDEMPGVSQNGERMSILPAASSRLSSADGS